MKSKELTVCHNCGHFTTFYTKSRFSYWVADGCGRCRIREYTEEERARLPYGFGCEKWEEKARADLSAEAIRERLTDISAKLHSLINDLSRGCGKDG